MPGIYYTIGNLRHNTKLTERYLLNDLLGLYKPIMGIDF